jgi:hypothetical protein
MAGNLKNNFGGKIQTCFFGGQSGWAMVMGPVLPVLLLVRPLLLHLSKLPATVHPVGLMAGDVKNNFGGRNSNFFFAGRVAGQWSVIGPVLPVSLLVWPLLPTCINYSGSDGGKFLKTILAGKFKLESLGGPCAACVTASLLPHL